MANLNELENLVDTISTLPSSLFPCFFIQGSELQTLRYTSLELAKMVINNCKRTYRGAVKSFTIKFPYICDDSAETDFLQRLKKSVSIAKDCYDSFTGLICIEINPEWSYRGPNQHFHCLTEYIRENQQICYILHAVQSKTNVRIHTEEVFCALKNSALWIRIDDTPPELEPFIELFQTISHVLGFQISCEACELLPELLQSQVLTSTAAAPVILRILGQLELDRRVSHNPDKAITENDIRRIIKEATPSIKWPIGFQADR